MKFYKRVEGEVFINTDEFLIHDVQIRQSKPKLIGSAVCKFLNSITRERDWYFCTNSTKIYQVIRKTIFNCHFQEYNDNYEPFETRKDAHDTKLS